MNDAMWSLGMASGAFVGFAIALKIIQGFRGGATAEPPPAWNRETIQEYEENMIAESDFNKGEDGQTSGGENYKHGQSTRVVYPDPLSGSCPVGFRHETLNTQRGTVDICREIITA